MKFEKLTLRNFKQFYGTQEIVFAGSDNKEQNVTVFYGVNGKGKTTIFRAINLALFNEPLLDQDGDEHFDTEDFIFCNKAAKEEMNGEAECFAELTFTHQHERFILKRTIDDDFGVNLSDKVTSYLQIIDMNTGHTKEFYDDDVTEDKIPFIKKHLKSYYFFDGEKTEELTRSHPTQKKLVAKGFRAFLKIDALERLSKAGFELEQEIQRSLDKTGNTKLDEKREVFKKASNELDSFQKEKEDTNKEIKFLKHSLASLDKALNNFEKTNEIKTKINNHTMNLDRLKETHATLLQELWDLNRYSSFFLSKNLLNEVTVAGSSLRNSIPVPIGLKKESIEHLLERGRCVCQSCATEGTEIKQHLEFVLEELEKNNHSVILDEFYKYLTESNHVYERNKERVWNTLSSLDETEQKIKKEEETIHHLKEELGELSGCESLSEKIASYKTFTHSLSDQEVHLLELEKKIDKKRIEVDSLRKQVKELEVKEGIVNEKTLRRDYISLFNESLTQLMEKFEEKIKPIVSKQITKTFHSLLSEGNALHAYTVTIGDDYSLQLVDEHNQPFLGNISAGERQMLSISYCITISSLSNNANKMMDMPIFIDTPFSRLSLDHRLNLLNTLPNCTNQWIFTSIDTELCKPEATCLLETGKWGKVYELVSNGKYKTKMEYTTPKTFVHKLKEDQDDALLSS
jgi:DNA sulfur modification protein DndD